MVTRTVHPKIIEAFNAPAHENLKRYLEPKEIKNRLIDAMLVSSIGEMAWASADLYGASLGWNAKQHLFQIALLTGAAAAIFSTITSMGLQYFLFVKEPDQQVSTNNTPSRRGVVDFFREKGRALFVLFLVSLIAEALWIIYFEKLIVPLATLWTPEEEDSDSFAAFVAAMAVIFGGLTTLTTDLLSKLCGLIFSDPGDASLSASMVCGIGGAMCVGIVSKAEEKITGLTYPGYVSLVLFLAGSVAGVSSGMTATVNTLCAYSYNKLVNRRGERETENQPLLEQGEQPAEPLVPTLLEEGIQRLFKLV